MRVLIADKFSANGATALAQLGAEVIDKPSLGAGDIPEALESSGAHVLIVRSTQVTADAFVRGKDLKLVIRAGAGVNTIDLPAANAAGVSVANCPGKNAIAVAELAMGLMLALDRHIPDAVAQMRVGSWQKGRFGKARGLKGRRLGLVGFGAIAREVAVRAQAFGMDVHAYDVILTEEIAREHGVTLAVTLPDVLRGSDVVSVHVPYIKGKTHHLIGQAELALMPKGASLIHTSRGGVVDDAALAAAVKSGHVRAAVDVYEQTEPEGNEAQWQSELVAAGAYGTPHIGASTDEASEAVADETIRIVADFMSQGVVHNLCNEPRAAK